MTILTQIREYIEALDKKQFQRSVIVLLSIIFVVNVFLMYRYYRSINTHLQRIASINKKRQEVKILLERFEKVKKQQSDVDTLLAKDKEFKIAGYFNDILKKLGIVQNKIREPETSTEELDNGYREIELYAGLSNMNMQKITSLLDTLEQNERIYTKELEIYRPDGGKTVNVNLHIATLEPIVETPE
jgi:hypothetical protein